ncbi:hypothetical protein [Sunxiuqinia sp. sy24]|uniref:hypothetical protein n=1 Tax=Sunxiuqinia sp. sy24 TaxID=3461495 RepID=UPI004045F599
MRIQLGGILIRTLLLLLSLGFFVGANAQKGVSLEVIGRLSTDDGNNDDVKILILKNGEEEQTFTPPRSGRFRFEFDYNNEFNMTFFKEGYYKKMIIVSTHIPQDVLDENSEFPPFEIDVSLVREIPGVDKSFTYKPAGRVFYNANIDNFDSEVYFSDIQLAEQAANARAQEQALTEEQRAAQAQREADYQRAIARANSLTTDENYEAAIEQLQRASSLFPERDYPRDRIAELNDLISALRLAEERRQQSDQAYQEKILQADDFMTRQNYEDARAVYREALELKTEDAYATAQIEKAGELMAQQQLDRQYQDLITRAEGFYADNKLEDAKSLYQEALAIKPEQATYVNEQISKIDNELAALQELAQRKAQYKELMEQGEKAFGRENYQEAIDAFREALTFMPDDETALQRISEAENFLLAIQNRENYKQSIAEAEQALKDEDLVLAKSHFSQALSFLPDETYPKEQIAEIDKAMAQLAQFEQLVEQAAMFASQEDFQQAKQLLMQALLIKEDEAVRNRVQEMDEQLARLELENNYADLINRADEAKAGEAYTQAKSLYTQALELKKEEYPAAQIREIDDILARIKEQQQLDEQFNELLASAEEAFSRADYTAALGDFNAALAVKPDNQEVKDRIAATEGKMRQLEQKQQFDALVAKADQDFESESYEQAKASYQEALAILPQENYPKNQLDRIDQIMTQLEAERKLEADYLAAIQAGDDLLTAENYSAARDSYQMALGLKPAESYPQQKITEIDAILAQQQREQLAAEATRAAYDEVIQRADAELADKQYAVARLSYEEALGLLPEENYPKEQLAVIDRLVKQERETAFQNAIASGDQFFQEENYSESKSSYNSALEIKPNDTYAKAQIARITTILEQLAQDQLQREKMQQDYNEKIKNADLAFNSSQFAAARNLYQQANTLMPDETYPMEQIAKIDELLAEIQKREELNQTYAQTMRQAETAFKADQLEEALRLFQEASSYNPEEQVPLQRIAEIQKLLAQREELARLAAEEEQQRLAIQQAKQERYAAALADAQQAFDQKEYAAAKKHWVGALTIFPDEQYPKDRIAQIDLLIEQEAMARMEQQRKAQQDSLQRIIQLAYDQKIAAAEAAEEFQNAIAYYSEAKEIIPANSEELDRRIEQVKNKLRQKQGVEASYALAIQEGDQFFENEAWANAKRQYEEALTYKSDETYPKEQVLLANQKIKAQEAAYAEAIRLGDQFFNAENWIEAKEKYKEALLMKPLEQYPANQLVLIDQKEKEKVALVAEQTVVEEPAPAQVLVVQTDDQEVYNSYIASADENYIKQDYKVSQYYYQKALNEKPAENYPKQRLEEIREIINRTMSQHELADYEQAIQRADQAFADKQYGISKFYYNKALEVKSWEQYPKDQVREIQRLTNSLLSQLKEEEYQDLIAKADEAFIQKNYSVARAYYNRSLTVKIDEPYPKIKLDEITESVQQELKSENEEAYEKLIADGDQAMLSKSYSVARFYYQKALGMKPQEAYPREQLEVIKESLKTTD